MQECKTCLENPYWLLALTVCQIHIYGTLIYDMFMKITMKSAPTKKVLGMWLQTQPAAHEKRWTKYSDHKELQ